MPCPLLESRIRRSRRNQRSRQLLKRLRRLKLKLRPHRLNLEGDVGVVDVEENAVAAALSEDAADSSEGVEVLNAVVVVSKVDVVALKEVAADLKEDVVDSRGVAVAAREGVAENEVAEMVNEGAVAIAGVEREVPVVVAAVVADVEGLAMSLKVLLKKGLLALMRPVAGEEEPLLDGEELVLTGAMTRRRTVRRRKRQRRTSRRRSILADVVGEVDVDVAREAVVGVVAEVVDVEEQATSLKELLKKLLPALKGLLLGGEGPVLTGEMTQRRKRCHSQLRFEMLYLGRSK